LSFHHLNRISEHLDWTTLTLEQQVIAKEIANAINSRWGTFRVSPEQLQRRTGLPASEAVLWAESLVEAGIFTATPSSDGKGISYRLPLVCPEGCTNGTHSTKAERKARGEVISDKQTKPKEKPSAKKDLSAIEKMSIEKSANAIENKTEIEEFSLVVFSGLVAQLPLESQHAIYANYQSAYEVALGKISTHKPGSPSAYIKASLVNSLTDFLKPLPKAPEQTSSNSHLLDYEEVIYDYCTEIGLDYDRDFSNEDERKLRHLYYSERLTPEALRDVYNSGKPLSQQILPEGLRNPY